jgi:hypothetical protein
VQAGGFFIGSSSSGGSQAAGAIDDLYTYSVPLDSNTVYRLYEDFYPDYILNPNNYKAIASAPSNPTTTGTNIDAITGPGNLQWVGTAAVSITNANQVWITNTTFTVAANGSINLTFTIQGGLPGLYYDVFANSLLSFGPTGVPWAWMGQGTNSGTYLLNISSVDAFLILGTPQDSSNSFLTDAYQLLVSKTNPYVTDSDQDGIPTGWEILLGLNPNISNFTSTSERANYGYTPADWLNAVSGSKNGSISTDNEGNVQSVSQ